jgi:hypothetical protein
VSAFSPARRRFSTGSGIAADAPEAGEHRAALGALDGIEAQLTIIRSVLLLLS